MENPCKQCLVAPTCSKICWKKENYTALLRDAMRKQPLYISSNRANPYYKVYLEKITINTTDISKIQNRRNK
jgi:hypothetical protein